MRSNEEVDGGVVYHEACRSMVCCICGVTVLAA